MFSPSAPANVSTTSDMHDIPNMATVVHKRLLREPIDLGLLGDVFTRFSVKRNASRPLIFLCRLLPNEAIRTVSSQVEMFRDSFDSHGYVDASAPFLVSFTRPGSSIHFEVTQLDLHEWGPNWVQEHEKFEEEIRGTEWEDLKDKKFLVWDGNHPVKAWMSRMSFENAVKLAKTSIDRHSMGLKEYTSKCEKAKGVVEQTFRDRAYKMLTIANPSNGNSFFQLIFNYDWSKKEVLHMLMSGKVKDEATIDMFGDNKKTLLHMQKELYWEELMEEGESIIEGLAMYDDVPTDGFGKWIQQLIGEGVMDDEGETMKDWANVDSKDTMYPKAWAERGVSQWELTQCPWWLDYPLGRVPPCEEGLWKDVEYLSQMLVVDICTLSEVSHIVESFLKKIQAPLSHISAPSNTVARLVWADFPTGLRVADVETDECPPWNSISTSLVCATLCFVGLFMTDEGLFVCLSLMDHLPKIHKMARKVGLVLHRTMSLHVESSYLYENGEHVGTLALAMFYREKCNLPISDREADEEVSQKLFKAQRNFIMESNKKHPFSRSLTHGHYIRGGAERSAMFFKWLVKTFSDEGDAIVDIFAGCGGLRRAVQELKRNYLGIENDAELARACLAYFA
ncbi:hypothetical protein L7F22_067255 [Adiantum nelumboides]|nr:hypothetical protein [Adiantum nelumboides]